MQPYIDLARRLAEHGPARYEHELVDFIGHARRLGAKPLLLSILADTREPDVVRERAFGSILAWLTDPQRAVGAPSVQCSRGRREQG